MVKLGLIAGGGALPVEIATHCQRAGRPFFVVRLKGSAGPELGGFPGAEVGIAELGKCFKALKRAGCKAVCFAGQVMRPDFRSLAPDLRGLRALPGVLSAARKGDDALLRALLGEFEKEGFAIEGANDGVHGLERIQEVNPDLLITDINMPKMDGFGLIEEVRKLPQFRGLPILVLSTESGDDKKSRAREAGASGWIVKPFNAEKLLSAVRRVTGKG